MIRSISIFTVVLVAIGAMLFFSSSIESDSATMDANNYRAAKAKKSGSESPTHHLPQVIKAPPMPENPNLGGEAIPNNFDARERLDRELMVNSYRHSATLQYLKLANRYFPIIEPILAEQGVPDDFKYLAVAESGLRNASSPAGAKGIWQFLAGTARERGLTVNSEVDQRYHVEKATRAACKYLKEAKRDYGTWMNAAACYNMGRSNMRKLMNAQKETQYYDIEMNEETARYVSRIVALKTIMQNPERYGFQLESHDLYPPFNYRVVEVNGPVKSWGDFAHKHGTSYRMLKTYNPWLRSSQLTNSAKRTYQVKLP